LKFLVVFLVSLFLVCVSHCLFEELCLLLSSVYLRDDTKI